MGFGKEGEEVENTMAIVDNAIAVARLGIPKGISSRICFDCGDPIPDARRQAQPGCKYCVQCQTGHDKHANIRVVTKML